jgi:hypothetical protein
MSMRSKLSLLWIFVTVNYIFCDVFTLHHGPTLNQLLTGTVNGIEMNQTFLLGGAVLLELPMAMIVAARLLPFGPNRIANIAVGLIMTVVQGASLFVGDNTLHYMFFSVIEIATTLTIFWLALRWRAQADAAA